MKEQLQNRLYNFHAQPSKKAWDKIISELDSEPEKNLSDKLINFQSVPPSYVWDNIASSLTEAPVVSFQKRFSKPARFGAVAASLLAIAMIANLFINKRSAADSMALPAVEQTSIPAPLVLKRDTNALATNNNITADSQESVPNHKRKNSKKMPLQAYTSASDREDLTDRVLENNYPMESGYLDRYMVFSKASGEAFRLSKKLFDLFACSDDDEDCKQKIQAIQEKMADPSVTVTSDFSGVLAMLQNMNNP